MGNRMGKKGEEFGDASVGSFAGFFLCRSDDPLPAYDELTHINQINAGLGTRARRR